MVQTQLQLGAAGLGACYVQGAADVLQRSSVEAAGLADGSRSAQEAKHLLFIRSSLRCWHCLGKQPPDPTAEQGGKGPEPLLTCAGGDFSVGRGRHSWGPEGDVPHQAPPPALQI